jgi:hypothetical protein
LNELIDTLSSYPQVQRELIEIKDQTGPIESWAESDLMEDDILHLDFTKPTNCEFQKIIKRKEGVMLKDPRIEKLDDIQKAFLRFHEYLNILADRHGIDQPYKIRKFIHLLIEIHDFKKNSKNNISSESRRIHLVNKLKIQIRPFLSNS